MATKTVTVDDLDSTIEDAKLIEFALAGEDYEIDLGAANENKLRETLEPWIACARKAKPVSRRVRAPRTTAGVSTGEASTAPKGAARVAREQTQAIRVWARKHGYDISDRGRIPGRVQEAYHSNDPDKLRPPASNGQGSVAQPAMSVVG